ncbi:MAG: lysine biosynthesis protein LysX, partial [Conexivisphaerales archaeon]
TSDYIDRYDVLLQRCISHSRGLHVSAIFEAMGILAINSYEVSAICDDKLLTTLRLSRKGIPTPKTRVAFNQEQALKALDELGYPAVIKPIVGSWGRLVARVRDREEAAAVIESRASGSNPNDHILYLQEYIKRPQRDIRAIVAGDELIATVYRYQPPNDWRTNVARGGTSEEAKLGDAEREILLKAAEAVGGGILGIDAMEGPSGIVVHEVNSTVEFRGASTVSTNNIPRKMVEYALRVAKR